MMHEMQYRGFFRRVSPLLLVFLIGLGLLSSFGVMARSYDDVIESGYIEVALYEKFPPYSYIDDGGEAAGVDVDVAKEIAKEMGVELRWLWIGADETVEDDLRNAIWKGRKIDRRKADIMMRAPFDSRFSYGVDGYGLPRNELVIMFAPYHTEHWSIARNMEKVGPERNLAIFRFEKIGVEIDTLPDSFLLSTYRGALRNNVVHFNTLALAADALVKDEVAAIVGTHTQVVWSLGDNAKKFDIDDDGLGEMGSEPWMIGIAARHEFRQLSHVINRIVEDLISSGKMKSILANYGTEYQIPEYYSE